MHPDFSPVCITISAQILRVLHLLSSERKPVSLVCLRGRELMGVCCIFQCVFTYFWDADKCVNHSYSDLCGRGGFSLVVFLKFLGFICVFGVVITDASSPVTLVVFRGNADTSLLQRSAAAWRGFLLVFVCLSLKAALGVSTCAPLICYFNFQIS